MEKFTLRRRDFARSSAIALAALSVGQGSRAFAGKTERQRSGRASGRPQGSTDAIEAIVDFCLALRYEDLPARVIEITRLQVLDTIGIALAGASAEGIPALRMFTAEMGGKAESHLWGTSLRVPAHAAVRLNGAAAHALDYDDTHERSYVHPAVITVPAVLALAEQTSGISGKEIIVATALGTDISCRLAMAGQPGVSPITIGWHNTTTYGYLSSALVAGRLLGLNRDQMIYAAGIAYHQAAGNAQAHIDGALTKRLGPGLAGSAGVLSAQLAQRGLTGARDVLEGPVGLYNQYH
ncbi:MAG: MmgE/PrpD family protein, partial [Spongiibacteraceae bacterium]|nr:MmgE/PrpD family protein [Spongiibacteraceae bacterium]